MCGFVGAFDLNSGSQPLAESLKEELRSQILEMSKRIRHRGPDWSGVYTGENAILSHERLAIVDPLSGKQPLVSDDEKIILAVNGEIYNHKKLREEFASSYKFRTQSDCEVIIPLYKKFKSAGNFSAMIEKLSGKPGLLATSESLIKSGVLGEEYLNQLSFSKDEEVTNSLVSKVLTDMKNLSSSLPDKDISAALCASADGILEQIELEDQKSRIF